MDEPFLNGNAAVRLARVRGFFDWFELQFCGTS
jgi:hypothetical protein